MSYDLQRIVVDDSEVRKLLGSKLANSIRAKNAVQITNKVAQLALQAFQSKVPIDTGELRDSIYIQYATARNLEARIYVLKDTHYGRDSIPRPMAEVINYLQYGSGQRSRPSVAISPYTSVTGPTAPWITTARRAFAQTRRNYLRGLSR